MKYEIHTTAEFNSWVSKLKDRQAKKAVALRIARMRDCYEEQNDQNQTV